MKHVSKRLFLIFSAVLLVILSACSSGSTTPSASPAGTEKAQPTTDAGKSNKKLKIGLTVPTLSNPFFVAMSKGAQEAASKYNAEVGS